MKSHANRAIIISRFTFKPFLFSARISFGLKTLLLSVLLVPIFFMPATFAGTSIFDISTPEINLTRDPSGPLSEEAFAIAVVSAESAINTAITELETEIRNDLPSADQETYMDGMSNASVMAGKGIGSDHVSDINTIMVGASVGAGIDLGNLNRSDLTSGDADFEEVGGLGVQGAFLVGTNLHFLPFNKLGPVEMKDLDLFLNFFTYDLDQDDFTADTKSLGFRVRWRWFGPKTLTGLGLLKWTGLNVTTGYQYNKMNFGLTKAFSETQQTTVDGIAATGTYTGTAVLDVDVKSHSIPLEIATGIRMLYFLTLYGGLGMDFNSGKTTANASLENSTLTLAPDAGQGILGNATATATLNLGDEGEPEAFLSRYFLGIQLNAPFTRIFAQLDKAIGKELYGVSAGLRFLY